LEGKEVRKLIAPAIAIAIFAVGAQAAPSVGSSRQTDLTPKDKVCLKALDAADTALADFVAQRDGTVTAHLHYAQYIEAAQECRAYIYR
jgi:hypothetical protein